MSCYYNRFCSVCMFVFRPLLEVLFGALAEYAASITSCSESLLNCFSINVTNIIVLKLRRSVISSPHFIDYRLITSVIYFTLKYSVLLLTELLCRVLMTLHCIIVNFSYITKLGKPF